MQPYIRKTICSYPHCNNYCEKGSKYCAEHKKQCVSRDTTSKYANFYKTSWWTKNRKQFLLSHIWCEECLRKGIHTPATLPHHTQGFCDWTTFCDISKWEAICASCHSQIHTQVTNEELYNKFNNQNKSTL